MERIDIENFAKDYKKIQNKELKYTKLKSVITRTYCPVIEKKFVLDNMLESSVKDGSLNMFINRVNFISSIIALYTNLEPSKDEKGRSDAFKMYDVLKETNLINDIIDEIGELEMDELITINSLVINEWKENNTSIKALISNNIRKFGEVIGTILSVSKLDEDDLGIDDEKIEFLKKLADNSVNLLK